eukprot:PhM_4_TR9363/c0_g2_i1/m.14248
MNKLRRLVAAVREKHAVVCDDADGVSHHRRPAAHERAADVRLEEMHATAVDNTRDDLRDVVRLPDRRRRDAEQLLGWVQRLLVRPLHNSAWQRCRLRPVQRRHDLAGNAQRLGLVGSEVVRHPRHGRVHLGAAEFLVPDDLTGGHLHERRTAEVHLRLFLDHDDVVRQPRVVRAAGGAAAENDGYRRQARFRALRKHAEGVTAAVEDLVLLREVRTGGLNTRDNGQPILVADLEKAQPFDDAVLALSTPGDRGDIDGDAHLDAVHDTDARDHTRPAVFLPATETGERHELEEGGVRVQHRFKTLPRRELSTLLVSRNVTLATFLADHLDLLLEFRGELGHHLEVVHVRRARRVDVCRHGLEWGRCHYVCLLSIKYRN